jgi:hypothetical protein
LNDGLPGSICVSPRTSQRSSRLRKFVSRILLHRLNS